MTMRTRRKAAKSEPAGVAGLAEADDNASSSSLDQQSILSDSDATLSPTAESLLTSDDAGGAEEDHDSLKHEAAVKLMAVYMFAASVFSYLILFIFGHIRDFFGKIFRRTQYAFLKPQNGFAPLNADLDGLFTRRAYARIRDVFNRPTTGVPSRTITLLDRYPADRHKRDFILTGGQTECLNLASYNYLGMAQSHGPCADDVDTTINIYGVGTASTALEVGVTELHGELEGVVARFVGTEAAVCFNMGFAVNSTAIPALVDKGCLIISDELNHSSIVFGARVSGATIKVFKHNDTMHLESIVRDAVVQGQPRARRPWKKILIIVEGLYSMEGVICKLKEIVEIKNKYRCYLYLDEAHSIGAMGPTGRGVCDLLGVDPREVDILMGTFTKSFGAAGGYIAGPKHIIEHLKTRAHTPVYAESIPAFVAQQVISSLRIIMGEDGTDLGQRKIDQLARNSSYLSSELKKRGFVVYGDQGSPIIPILLYGPSNVAAFSRMCLERGIAVVVVGYPATPLLESRVRLCCSASHTQQDLDYLIEEMTAIADEIGTRVKRS